MNLNFGEVIRWLWILCGNRLAGRQAADPNAAQRIPLIQPGDRVLVVTSDHRLV